MGQCGCQGSQQRRGAGQMPGSPPAFSVAQPQNPTRKMIATARLMPGPAKGPNDAPLPSGPLLRPRLAAVGNAPTACHRLEDSDTELGQVVRATAGDKVAINH